MKSLSRAWLFVAPGTVAWTKLFRPWDFLGKCTGVGCCFLLQGIFPTQGLNPGLSHCRQILYHLSYQGSPFSAKENEKVCLTFKKEVMRKAWLVHKHLSINAFWWSSRPWEHWTQSAAYILVHFVQEKSCHERECLWKSRMLLHFLGHEELMESQPVNK